MTAITAAAKRLTRNVAGKRFAEYAVGTGASIVAGSLVALNLSTGRAVHATAAASRKFLGLAEETVTGNTAGTVLCRVAWNIEALVDLSTQATKARIGSNLCIRDNNTVTTLTNAGTAAVRVRVGEFVQIDPSTSDGWIALRNYAVSDI